MDLKWSTSTRTSETTAVLEASESMTSSMPWRLKLLVSASTVDSLRKRSFSERSSTLLAVRSRILVRC